MCGPAALPIAVMVAGAATSAWSTNNQTKSTNRNLQARQTAKENAFKAGMDRQSGYADEAGNAFRPMVANQGASSYADQLAANNNNRLQAFSDAKLPANQDYSFAGSTPGNVKAFQEQTFNESDAKTDRDNAGLAALSGYGDTNFNLGLGHNSYNRAFGNLSDKATRDRKLIDLDMVQADSRAFKAPNSALSIANQLGKLGVMIGASMMGGAGGAAAGAGASTVTNRGADGTPIPVRRPVAGGQA